MRLTRWRFARIPGCRRDVKLGSDSRNRLPIALQPDNGDMSDLKLTAIDTSALPWEERPNQKIGRSLYRKNLIVDPDTGMEIRLVRYPAGVVNPLHTHPCAHGMYVLEGKLVTHDGQYGPGHFIWFPEGSLMEHGATAEEDVTVLFITNKRFEIHYQ
jgi:quercetin dioxygenase-like cupin family protein